MLLEDRMLNPAKPIDLADAVGVEGDKHWYVAIVRHGDERRCGVQLTSYGYENFIPVQRVARRYPDGRKKKVEKLVLPSRVFVRATEFVRLKYIVNFPVVLRFMVDRARRKSSDSASEPRTIALRNVYSSSTGGTIWRTLSDSSSNITLYS